MAILRVRIKMDKKSNQLCDYMQTTSTIITSRGFLALSFRKKRKRIKHSIDF